MRLTVGPLPPAVYWRRRAIVLGGALLILFVLFQACTATGTPGERASAGPSSDLAAEPEAGQTLLRPTVPGPDADRAADEDAEEGSDDSSEDDDSPAQAEDAPPVASMCADGEMRIMAEASGTELSQGDSVQFKILIRNDSDRSCLRDVGGDERELYLRPATGSGRIWSSRDCDPPTGEELRKLAPAFVTDHYIVWNGRTSSECDGATPTGPVAEAGEYELVARLGTADSEPVIIRVR